MNSMAKELRLGEMVQSLKDNSITVKSMEQVFSISQTGIHTRVNLIKICCKDLEFSHGKKRRNHTKETGFRTRWKEME